MNHVYKRTITGAAIIAVVVSSVLLGRYSFFVLCISVSMIGLFEFYRLFGIRSGSPRTISGMALCASLLMTFFLFTIQVADWKVLLINLPLVSFTFLTVLFLRSENAFSELAFIFLGQAYVTLAFILLYGCAHVFGEGLFYRNILLAYFFCLWANDTGAFIFGSLFGKYPLAKTISPNKTWEGSIGGALMVVVVAFINHYFFGHLSLMNWLALGVIVIVMGTVGDLVKSAMKRSRNVKDTGNILPGHGGILDRFDSLIGSVPFVYGYLSMLD